MNKEIINEFWKEYQAFCADDALEYYDAFEFGNSPAMADRLAKLVINGQKRATTSLLALFESSNEKLPIVGEYSIILAHDEPVAVIRDVNIETLPFRAVTEEHARIEGEGDSSLAYWRDAHIEFFGEECKRLGLEFDEDILVVFEQFEVVYTKK